MERIEHRQLMSVGRVWGYLYAGCGIFSDILINIKYEDCVGGRVLLSSNNTAMTNHIPTDIGVSIDGSKVRST